MPIRRILLFFSICFWMSNSYASGIEGQPLSIYEDNTMLFGVEDSPYSKNMVFKFQISAKLQILDSPFYLAYTQRSFMDVGHESYPFYDHNYRPEFFYVQRIHGKKILQAMQLGIAHSSNGKDGDDSRGWNYVYLQLYLKKGRVYLQPMLIIPFLIDKKSNPDIRDSYGFIKANLGYRWPNGIELSSNVYAGQRFNRYAVATHFSIPWNVILNRKDGSQFVTSLWLQAYHGYGETLLGYNTITQSIALGLGIRG